MRIQVELNELREAGMAMKQLSCQYEELINRICRQIADVNSAWQGADSLAFAAKAESLRPDLMRLKEVTDSYGSCLGHSADVYCALQNERAASARML